MRRGSLIDDVSLVKWEDQGPPILFTNPEIRRMLRLAKAGPKDVFYDLGSGWGQNLIIALTEFGVKNAVGMETDRERHRVSLRRLERRRIPQDRGTVLLEDFQKLLSGRSKKASLGEATIVFYGLSTDRRTLLQIKRQLRTGSRLVYYERCLFPEIMPVMVDFPFYVSVSPFRRPGSQYEWLSAVVRKGKSSILTGRRPDLQELWDELSHDYDVEGMGNPVLEYKARLIEAVGARTTHQG